MSPRNTSEMSRLDSHKDRARETPWRLGAEDLALGSTKDGQKMEMFTTLQWLVNRVAMVDGLSRDDDEWLVELR